GAEVVVLRDDVDAIAQITQVLQTTHRRYQSLHIVTHGAPGRLQFSAGELSLETLSDYAADVVQWRHYLATDASLLLYGCQLASGTAGSSLLSKLHLLSSLPIAAAIQKVGCSALGGDWQLPYKISQPQISQPQCALPFSLQAQRNYQHVLVTTNVVTIVPTANDNDAPVDSNITITFDADIEASTVNASTITVMGDVTGIITGTFTVSGNEVLFNPNSDFQPGEQIEVVVTSGVQATDLTPANAFNHRFLSATPASSGAFSAAVPASSDTDLNYAVALSDLNGDGAIDAFVVADLSANKVLLNNGDGTFTPSSNAPSNNTDSSFGVELGDLDGDGHVDAVVANLGTSNQILMNDGTGDFSSGVVQLGDSDFSSSVGLGDLNGDGHLDVIITNYGASTLLINDGTGQFTSSTLDFGSNSSNDIDLGDLDGDGDLDAFIANNGEADTVLINNGNAEFTATNLSSEGDSLFAELGDLNGDGHLDAFVTVANSADQVWFNDGSGGFSLAPVQLPTNLSSYGATLVDINGDGALDVFVANTAEDESSQLLLNNGNGVFSVSPTSPDTGNIVTLNARAADLNGDGAVDLFVVNEGANQVFLNDGAPAANTAPTFTEDALLVAVNEGDRDPSGETIATLFIGKFQDSDSGSSLTGVAVVANAANSVTEGDWQYSVDGVSWQTIAATVSDSAALALSESTKVRFLPIVGYNGTPPSISLRALDNTYSDGFSTASTDQIIDVSVNGGSSAISADTHAIATTINSIANVIFVDQTATGSNDGSTWENAHTSLQAALAIASNGDEIWLAQGTYTPGTTREDSFEITGDIAIYGGFVGGEASRSNRDFQSNLTILSGEIGAAGNSDNSYHVVTGNSTAGALVDGVIIQDGNTQGA
ncbi:MAG: FG-GAP-like repeat-containing protein, partial [Cyanobacteria bacterium J06555_13]